VIDVKNPLVRRAIELSLRDGDGAVVGRWKICQYRAEAE
jgi:hypothetical protein